MGNSTNCLELYNIPTGTIKRNGFKPDNYFFSAAIWTNRIFLSVISLVQLVGNGLVIWLLVFRTKLKKSNIFILALAVTDLISAIISPIGLYREDLGLLEYELPIATHYFYDAVF